MPDRYTGTPSRATASATRSASPARHSAWLPITISGRCAPASAAAAACTREAGGAGGTTSRARGSTARPLPANIFSTCRPRYQRSSRSATDVPLPAASAYHWRMLASSYSRSTAHSMHTGPGTPARASANASTTAGARSATRLTWTKRLTCGSISGRCAMSCNAPRPCSAVGAAPPISSSGDCASCAFFSAVIVLVRPGPAVTATTPGTPVSRAVASAANTAVASSRQSTTRMPRAFDAARIGEMWPPHSVYTTCTPCACRAAATRSPPCGCPLPAAIMSLPLRPGGRRVPAPAP